MRSRIDLSPYNFRFKTRGVFRTSEIAPSPRFSDFERDEGKIMRHIRSICRIIFTKSEDRREAYFASCEIAPSPKSENRSRKVIRGQV